MYITCVIESTGMLYQIRKKTNSKTTLNVKISAGNLIDAIRITGNFFLSPENTISSIEKNLIGLPVSVTPDFLAEHIHKTLGEHRAAFLGTSAEDIAEAVFDALQNPAETEPAEETPEDTPEEPTEEK